MEIPVSAVSKRTPFDEAVLLTGSGEAAWTNCECRAGLILLSGEWRPASSPWRDDAELTLSVVQGERRHAWTTRLIAARDRTLGLAFFNDGSPWTLRASIRQESEGPAAAVQIGPLRASIGVYGPGREPELFDFSEIGGREVDEARAFLNSNQGGLMNRLVSLFSAVETAERLGLRAYGWWVPNQHCAAELPDIFDLAASGIRTADPSPLAGRVEHWYNYLPGAEPIDLPSSRGNVVVHSTAPVQTTSVPMSTWSDVGAFFRRLVLAPAIRRKLKPFENQDFTKTIGFHIRRPYPGGAFAELERSKFNLDEELFMNLLADLKVLMPECERVLLCTNEPEMEEAVRARFGSFVQVYPKDSIDNTQDAAAVQDAVVDLMLLSRCKVLFSQNTSSFAVMASAIGQNDLFCLTQESTLDRYNFWAFESGQHTHSFGTARTDMAEFRQALEGGISAIRPA